MSSGSVIVDLMVPRDDLSGGTKLSDAQLWERVLEPAVAALRRGVTLAPEDVVVHFRLTARGVSDTELDSIQGEEEDVA